MHRICAPLAALMTFTAALAPAALCAQAAPVADRAAPALTLAQAQAQALQLSPELQAARHELQASDAAATQAGRWPNPELQALVEDARASTRTTTVQLAQPIELGGKRARRVAAAQLAYAQALVGLQERRAQVLADVSEAFFAAAIAQERAQLTQDSLDLAARATAAAAMRVQAGQVSPLQHTRAKVAQASADLERLQALAELRAARQRLGSLLGHSGSAVAALAWSAAAATDPAPWADQRPDLAAAPLVRLAALEVERRAALAEIEKARRTPDVTVTLGARRDAQAARDQLVLGLNLPLPLWDRKQGQVIEALRLQDKAAAELAAAQRRVRDQWEQLHERYGAARAEAQALERQVLPDIEHAWRAALRGFELGKFGFFEVLDAQRTLFQARAQHLRALGETHRLAAEMERLLGAPQTPQTPQTPQAPLADPETPRP